MKNMKNDILKKMALQAKMRLGGGYYEEQVSIDPKNKYAVKRKGLKVVGTNFLAVYALEKINSSKDEKLWEKVKKLLNEESMSVAPLSSLADKEEMKSMTQVEKTKYILELSSKFKTMKDRFEREKQIV